MRWLIHTPSAIIYVISIIISFSLIGLGLGLEYTTLVFSGIMLLIASMFWGFYFQERWQIDCDNFYEKDKHE